MLIVLVLIWKQTCTVVLVLGKLKRTENTNQGYFWKKIYYLLSTIYYLHFHPFVETIKLSYTSHFLVFFLLLLYLECDPVQISSICRRHVSFINNLVWFVQRKEKERKRKIHTKLIWNHFDLKFIFSIQHVHKTNLHLCQCNTFVEQSSVACAARASLEDLLLLKVPHHPHRMRCQSCHSTAPPERKVDIEHLQTCIWL